MNEVQSKPPQVVPTGIDYGQAYEWLYLEHAAMLAFIRDTTQDFVFSNARSSYEQVVTERAVKAKQFLREHGLE